MAGVYMEIFSKFKLNSLHILYFSRSLKFVLQRSIFWLPFCVVLLGYRNFTTVTTLTCCIIMLHDFTTRTNTQHKLIMKVVSVGGSSMCSLQLTWFFSRSRISWRARSMMHWPAQRAKPNCWIDMFWVFRVTQCLWRMDLWKWSGANMKLDFLQCVHLIFWPNKQMKLAFGLVSLIWRGGTKSIYVQWFSVRFLRSATKLNVRAVNHQFFNQPVGRVWGTNVGKGLGRDLLHVGGLFDPSLGIATLPATCQL